MLGNKQSGIGSVAEKYFAERTSSPKITIEMDKIIAPLIRTKTVISKKETFISTYCNTNEFVQ